MMTDIFSKKKRSEIMSKIGSKDTNPEKKLRSALWNLGLRYRKHYKVEGVEVDIAFPKQKIAIFVDGCFWHGCEECKSIPENNREFWKDKIERNQERDEKQTEKLESEGWKVIRVWEHEISDELGKTVEKIESEVNRVSS